jgi:predicted nucleic acid-binding protein
MSVFVDTSAFYALLADNDVNHVRARDAWTALAATMAHVQCTNYVLLETTALLQHRLGINAVRVFQEEIVPVLHVEWIGSDDHSAAVDALLTAGRRELSLVDCTSFGVMRRLGIRQAFAYDEHFTEQGFECLS